LLHHYLGLYLSGFHYLAENQGQLTASPSKGPQVVTSSAVANVSSLPLPSSFLPTRFLQGGQILVSSSPVWVMRYSYPTDSVQGITGGVQADIYDDSGSTIVCSVLESDFTSTPLTGSFQASPAAVSQYFSPLFYNTTPLVKSTTNWASGAAYLTFTGRYIKDYYVVLDFAVNQTNSGTTPIPVATGTTLDTLMSGAGILVTPDGFRYTLALGTISLINGVKTYVATNPRPSPTTTPAYMTFYELNGNVYAGEIYKAGTVMGGAAYASAPGDYPNNLNYTNKQQFRLNGAAITTLKDAVAF
jgi:hypothetical protein